MEDIFAKNEIIHYIYATLGIENISYLKIFIKLDLVLFNNKIRSIHTSVLDIESISNMKYPLAITTANIENAVYSIMATKIMQPRYEECIIL